MAWLLVRYIAGDSESGCDAAEPFCHALYELLFSYLVAFTGRPRGILYANFCVSLYGSIQTVRFRLCV